MFLPEPEEGATTTTSNAPPICTAMAVTAYYKMDPLRQNFAQQVEAHYADQDAKLEQASAAEQAAVAADPTGHEPEGKHRADLVVYDPPSNLIG